MQDKLQKLFTEIDLDDNLLSYFSDASIEKVVIYDNNKLLDFIINTKEVLPIDVYNNVLYKLIAYFHQIKEVKLIIRPKEVDNKLIREYYLDILKNICLDRNKYNIFLERDIDITDNMITIKAYNKIECTNLLGLKQELIDKMYRYGVDIDINVDLILDGDNELKNQIEKEKEVTVSTTKITKKEKEVKDDKKPVYHAKKTTEITPIKDVIYEVDNINIKGCIFGIDYFESKSGYKIITLKVTDYTDSMYVKMFTKDDDEYKLIKKLLKEGNWYNFYGKAVMDKFANEIVFNTRYKDTEQVDSPEKEEIVDNEPIKRVELHAHTMMSQMDGITRVDLGKHTCELVTKAINMGYRGVAITDHNGCQAFPIAYGLINDHNKKIENPKDHFKGLYGTELTLVDDTVNISVRPSDLPLEDTIFVVFDTETTGFNAGGADQMIEIGAVTKKNNGINKYHR